MAMVVAYVRCSGSGSCNGGVHLCLRASKCECLAPQGSGASDFFCTNGDQVDQSGSSVEFQAMLENSVILVGNVCMMNTTAYIHRGMRLSLVLKALCGHWKSINGCHLLVSLVTCKKPSAHGLFIWLIGASVQGSRCDSVSRLQAALSARPQNDVALVRAARKKLNVGKRWLTKTKLQNSCGTQVFVLENVEKLNKLG